MEPQSGQIVATALQPPHAGGTGQFAKENNKLQMEAQN